MSVRTNADEKLEEASDHLKKGMAAYEGGN